MSVVVDVNNLDFYRGRAIELITESQSDPEKLLFAARLLVYTATCMINQKEEERKLREEKKKIRREANGPETNEA